MQIIDTWKEAKYLLFFFRRIHQQQVCLTPTVILGMFSWSKPVHAHICYTVIYMSNIQGFKYNVFIILILEVAWIHWPRIVILFFHSVISSHTSIRLSVQAGREILLPLLCLRCLDYSLIFFLSLSESDNPITEGVICYTGCKALCEWLWTM